MMEKNIKLEATMDNFKVVSKFVDDLISENVVDELIHDQIIVAVEEIYVNVAHYAYGQLDENGDSIPDSGTGPVEVIVSDENRVVTITFIDSGIMYNPLEKPDPDVTKPPSERKIGGYGIFMVKKTMDDMTYKYEDNHNILSFSKKY